MVFESLVVELVNKYLGDFIENLDKSQLKIGIWGGDVVLKNLFIKESALDDLDLPVRVLHGNIGNLTLKVPWKNLYTAPVIANLDGLYLIVAPNAGIKYNAEKEEKAEFDAKQKELTRIEDAKKAKAERGKPKDDKQDSFAEKMATQVIKNLQVNVSNIHIRYEDSFSNPSKPFSLGITLKGLAFETTDENWKPTIIKDTVMMIHKMVKLDSLSMYWNSKTDSYMKMTRDDIFSQLQGNIVSPGVKTDYKYVIEPISSTAQLRLHTHPEKDDYSLPKVLLNVIFEQIAIALNKNQYQDVLEVLESFERMTLASKYRKYRPDVVEKKGNAKKWWHFAYNAILVETVRRRRNMFTWSVIKAHRDTCRKYKEAYKKKVINKKIAADVQQTLDDCEKELSVFNITLVRQQAEVELKKEGQKKKAEAAERGWFGGWLGGGSKKDKKKKEDQDITDQFAELMTPEEKNKMYEAIGYQENAADPTLPLEYNANQVKFQLKHLSVTLKDLEKKDPDVLSLKLQDVGANLDQRPAADAIKVNAKIDSLNVLGSAPAGGGQERPSMASSQNIQNNDYVSLLDAMFETNPLEGDCDTRVRVASRPIEIIYDANTINQLAEFFKPPESVYLKQLQAAAMAKFEAIKEQTATGLQHAIDEHKYTDISVDLKPSYVIIPENGVYKANCKMVVLHLGNLQINSEKQERTAIEPDAELSYELLLHRAYDKFNLNLKDVQLMFVGGGEDWQSAVRSGGSPMHILKPMSLNIALSKCILVDPKLPKIRIQGELPQLAVTMSDVRLQDILNLVQSIPFPESAPAPPEEEMDWDAIEVTNLASEGDADVLIDKYGESDSEDESGGKPKLTSQTSQEFTNAIDMELEFELKEVNLQLSQRVDNEDVPMVKVVLDSLGTKVKITTFHMEVAAYIGGIYVQHMQFKVPEALSTWLAKQGPGGKAINDGPLINLINTAIENQEHDKLLMVEYLKANRKNPEFATTYKNTEQKITAHFTALEILLHQEALMNLMDFAQKLVPPPKPTMEVVASVTPQTAAAVAAAPTQTTEESEITQAVRARLRERDAAIIDIAVVAKLDKIALAMCTKTKVLTDVKIQGLEAEVQVQKTKTQVKASLQEIVVFDPAPDTLYKEILSVDKGEKVFQVDLTVFNGATDGENHNDMDLVDTSVSLTTGTMKVFFLNKFVMDLLAFLDAFQTVKDSAAAAAEAAAESATSAAAELSAKQPRISLSINLKAPLIIAPQSSTSLNAVMLDLGRVELGNKFTVAGEKNKEGFHAVLDTMNVKLTQLKISRALMKDSVVASESLILEPVNISIDMVRNLSSSWYHHKPEVDLSGQLDAFAVTLSQGDFTVLMALLNENLGEKGQMPPPKPKAAVTPAKKTETAEVQAEAQPATEDPAPATTEAVWTKVKVNFTLQTINATLFSGENKLSVGKITRESRLSLGRFELKTIAVSLDMGSDTSMKAHVLLRTMSLDDTRPGRESSINRMVEPRVDFGGSCSNMIDLNFEQNAQQDKDVNLSVNGLYICVCIEYLMSLADFFTKGMPQAPAEEEKALVPRGAAGAPPPPALSAPTPPPAGDLRVKMAVNYPEIIMVEDAMNPETNALILNTHITFDMRQTPDTMNMNGVVKDFQIMSCCYCPSKRDETKILILNPLDVNLHGSAPAGGEQHIDVMVTDITMNVSPTTIRTITATLSGMAAKPVDATSEEVVIATFPDLWVTKRTEECNFWFLKSASEDKSLDAAAIEGNPEDIPPPRHEQLMLSVGKIQVKLEGEVGRRTVPLLITEMAFRAEVRDWSSKLYVSGELGMEVAYYNEHVAAWEPLIEPVETQEGGYKPWEITMEVTQNNEFDFDAPEEGEEEKVSMPQPKMCIEIASTDILQTTVSKTCIEVLTNLGQAFNDAYNLVEASEKEEEVVAPYIVKNHAGFPVTIKLDSTYTMPAEAKDMHVSMAPGAVLPLHDNEETEQALSKVSIIKNTQTDTLKKLIVVLEDFGATREVKLVKAEKRSFSLNHKSYPNTPWSLICQTDASYGSKTVTLRSAVQVMNHLPYTAEVYYRLNNDKYSKCGEVKSKKTFNVPLEAVYASPFELYFKVLHGNYGQSIDGINWKEVQPGNPVTLTCPSAEKGDMPLFFNVLPKSENVLHENTGDKTDKCYTLNLHPCVIFKNNLPMQVEYSIEGAKDKAVIEGGHSTRVYNAKVGKATINVKILEYQGKYWLGSLPLEEKPNPLAVWSFHDQEGNTMELGMHTVMIEGSRRVTLFCPYWIINKTEKSLAYKSSDDKVVDHPHDATGVVLFSFKSKSVFNKKKACLRVGDSEWSDKFSLDTVGSAGTVTCKYKGATYEVGVRISLGCGGLTKIITFTPYYMLVNEAPMPLRCREPEISDAQWFDIPAGGTVPFWPMQVNKKMSMEVQIKDIDYTKLETEAVCFNKAHTTLLPLQHEYGGLNVECNVMESAVEVKFQQYQAGHASVLIVNHTSGADVKYKQSGVKTPQTLGPNQVAMYTWTDKMGDRELEWSCGKKENAKNDLVKDGIGEFMFDSDNKVYWVSFLDGMQRVLLFTEDLVIATIAQQAGELEQLDQEICLKLQGFGLSLVNNVLRKELAYISVTSSGVIWETQKKKRFKALKLKQIEAIEEAYISHQNELLAGKKPQARITLPGKIEVDFDEMRMFKPTKAPLRRSYENGIWVQYRTSPHQLQFHAKIHRFQLDNQLPGAVFPTVLAPVPPPKSVAADSVPKPFTEVSVMMRKRDFDNVEQFKYCKVLVQEMDVRVDQGFINAMLIMFAGGEVTEEQELAAFKEDCKRMDTKLSDEVTLSSVGQQKNYYEILHFSPLKIHLSFSLYAGGGKEGDQKPVAISSDVVQVFLQSVGVVLSDIQDVIFKLGFFERNYNFYNQSQLTNEIVRHYSQQAIKQMYVLVLGLDVLGNPFGLIRGMATGIEDLFYEPYQGAIQGPEEFAEGLAYGVRSLFGHAVGGAAGAVSRITGALGKGIATLTLDDDYQRKRREQMAKKPTDLKEGLARGGKGLVMGVVDGVTGIVRKPMEGAKQEGVEGFFKGMGKGLVGAFTRPASGVIDFASTSFEGIKRAAEMGDEVRRVRPPRFLHKDGVVRAYSRIEAEGNDTLMDVEKGKYYESDEYIAHMIVTKDLKNVLVVTDNRVLFGTKGEIFGHWNCEWQYVWGDLREAPTLTSKGIQIILKEKQKKSFFSSGTVGKIIPVLDRKVAEWMVEKMKDTMQRSS